MVIAGGASYCFILASIFFVGVLRTSGDPAGFAAAVFSFSVAVNPFAPDSLLSLELQANSVDISSNETKSQDKWVNLLMLNCQ